MTTRDNSDLPEHRVAMVVFTTVRAVDLIDGAHIVRKALVDAFTDTRVVRPHSPVTLLARFTNGDVEVQVSEIAEVGVAAGNSYLWTEPTPKAYPREEVSADVDVDG